MYKRQGRTVVARFEGGYHGTHDFAQVSTHPDLAAAGDPRRPSAVADGPGIPPRVLEMTLVLPFNDLEGAKVLLAERAADVAAVIVEPVMGSCGCIPAEEGFLEGLREITRELGMLLIFDEVISLRLGYGGAQGVYSIEPDLTTMGKIIGGGLPVAAFGGSADLMGIVDPEAPVTMEQAGTYNGNPLGTAAGAATMRELTPTAVERLNAAGETLRTELREVFAAHELDAVSYTHLDVYKRQGPRKTWRPHRPAHWTERPTEARPFLSCCRGQAPGRDSATRLAPTPCSPAARPPSAPRVSSSRTTEAPRGIWW